MSRKKKKNIEENNYQIVGMNTDGDQKSITLKINNSEYFDKMIKQQSIGTGTVYNRYDPISRSFNESYTSTNTPYSKAITLPEDPHEIIKLAMILYWNDPIVGTVIDLMVDICSSGFQNECDDNKVKKFYDEWCKKVDMYEVLQWIFLEYFRTGNVYIYKSMNEQKEVNKKGRKTPKLGGKKYPTGYTVLNPLVTYVDGSLMFNKEIISVKLTQELKDFIRDYKNTELISLIPNEIIEAVRSGSGDKIPLDSELVNRITRKKQPYERYAIPGHHRCFEPCLYKQKLRLMDISTIEGLINQLITVTIGDKDFPATDQQLKAVAELFKTPTKAYCWAAGTKILMADYSEKNIEDINTGDEVITHLGNKTKVLNTHIRPQIGEGRKIKVLGQDRVLDMTHDHRLFVIKKSDMRCPYRKKDDGKDHVCWASIYVTESKNKPCIYCKNKPVPEIKKIKAYELEKGDFLLTPLTNIKSCQTKINYEEYVGFEPKKLNKEYEITPDFMRLLGYFAAEGNYKGNNGKKYQGLCFTFHKDEISLIDDVKKILKDIFGLHSYVYSPKNSNVSVVHVCSYELAYLYLNLIGEYSYGKELNNSLIQIDPELQLHFVAGFCSGDGNTIDKTYIYNGKAIRRTSLSFITVSEKLARQCVKMLERNMLKPTIKQRKPTNNEKWNINGKRIGYVVSLFEEDVKIINSLMLDKQIETKTRKFTRRIIWDNYILSPITNIITYNSTDKAYGFFVEAEEHSYIANGIASKNTIFWNHTLDLKFHRPEGIETLNQDKYAQVNDDILMGLGITRVLLDGQGANFSTAWVSILALLERLEGAREQVKRWLEKEYEKIAKDNGFSVFPTVRFDKLSLREDSFIKNIILAMYDRGLLSGETVLTDTGYKVDVEKERLKGEKKIFGQPPTLPFSGTQPGPKNQGRPSSPGDNNYTEREVKSDPGGNKPKQKAKSSIDQDILYKYINYYETELNNLYNNTKLKIEQVNNSDDDEESKKHKISMAIVAFGISLSSLGFIVMGEVYDLVYRDVNYDINNNIYAEKLNFLKTWHDEYVNKFTSDITEQIKDRLVWEVFDSNLYRIGMFAREGVMMANMQGNVAGNKSIGKTRAIWKCAFTSTTCAICIDRNNVVYDIDEIPIDHPNGHCWLEFI